MSDAPGETRVSALDALVFLAELAMLAALAVAGARLGPGPVASIALAIVLPVLAAVVWGRWLAPRAPRRLDGDARLIAKLAVFVVTAVLVVVSGLPMWGAGFGVVAVVVLCAAERTSRRRQHDA